MCVQLTADETELTKKLLREQMKARLTRSLLPWYLWLLVFAAVAVMLVLGGGCLWFFFESMREQRHMAFFEGKALSPDMAQLRDYLEGKAVLSWLESWAWLMGMSMVVAAMNGLGAVLVSRKHRSYPALLEKILRDTIEHQPDHRSRTDERAVTDAEGAGPQYSTPGDEQ